MKPVIKKAKSGIGWEVSALVNGTKVTAGDFTIHGAWAIFAMIRVLA